jgi:hypothetical protein
MDVDRPRTAWVVLSDSHIIRRRSLQAEGEAQAPRRDLPRDRGAGRYPSLIAVPMPLNEGWAFETR